MAQFVKLRDKWRNTINAVIRFPLTIALLAAAAVTNALAINRIENELFAKLTVSCIMGACVYAVLRLVYERFCINPVWQLLFTVMSAAASAVYYFLVGDLDWSVEITLRTTVVFFILLVLFLWVPAIKNSVDFNHTFMAAFKGLFTALFFNGVLYLGIMLIIGVTDLLLFSVGSKAYIHAANIIFVLFAPIHFLSLIPGYPGRRELKEDILPGAGEETEEEAVHKTEQAKKEEVLVRLITPARFLEALVSYVIIPIAAVFTVILLLYIITNITGEFWTDNLMEPLLVSYSVVTIIVYLLASTINNAFTKYFRMIFPKVLVPVVLFQTTSSVLKIGEAGITYGRYYVILFGMFAVAAGILFCFRPVRSNGLIAPILVGLSLISILPWIDAFSISRTNQIDRLEGALERNGMLREERIVPKAEVSEKDRQVIISAVHYLNSMGDTKNIKWLAGYHETYNFEAAFGFAEYAQTKTDGRYVTVTRDQNRPIPVAGYDFLQRMNIHSYDINNMQLAKYEINGKTYGLFVKIYSEYDQVIILEENGREINRIAMKDIFGKYEANQDKIAASPEEVTFSQDNEASTLTVIADSIEIRVWEDGRDELADINVLVKIK